MVGDIHDRMPAILMKEQEADWLDQGIRAEDAIQMIIPYPDQFMNAYPVSNRVGNVRHNDAELLKEVKIETTVQKNLFD